MEKKIYPPHETRFTDLIGAISINLGENKNFNEISAKMAHYDPDRFEALALKVYSEKNNRAIVTLYAKDKMKQESVSGNSKIPVHKFKLEMEMTELFSYLNSFNFTVTTGDYQIDNMEVINK